MVLAASRRTDVFKATAEMSSQEKAELSISDLKLIYLQCNELGASIAAVRLSLCNTKACCAAPCPPARWSWALWEQKAWSRARGGNWRRVTL